jgi:hypothetical protein
MFYFRLSYSGIFYFSHVSFLDNPAFAFTSYIQYFFSKQSFISLVIAVLSWTYLLTVSYYLHFTFVFISYVRFSFIYVDTSSCPSFHMYLVAVVFSMSLCHVSCSCLDILSASLLHSQQKQRLMYRAKS